MTAFDGRMTVATAARDSATTSEDLHVLGQVNTWDAITAPLGLHNSLGLRCVILVFTRMARPRPRCQRRRRERGLCRV